jgi:hypothetical protein
MNLAAYLDGFVACAKVARAGAGHPMDAAITTFATDYADGWRDCLPHATSYRCMREDYFQEMIYEDARMAAALRSPTVRQHKPCMGTGTRLLACNDPEDFDMDICTCVDAALEEIERECPR